MNSPEALLRLVKAVTPPSLFFICDRFFTAPLRALSPTGLFTAIAISHYRRTARLILEPGSRARVPLPCRNESPVPALSRRICAVEFA